MKKGIGFTGIRVYFAIPHQIVRYTQVLKGFFKRSYATE